MLSSKSFRKDYKKLSKSEIADTDVVIKKLINNETLDTSYNDHDLHRNYLPSQVFVCNT